MTGPFRQPVRTLPLLAVLVVGSAAVLTWCCFAGQNGLGAHNEFQEINFMSDADGAALPNSETQWKERLTTEQFFVLRRKGTERAFSGEYWDDKSPGTYCCAGCGQPLFPAETKYDSGTGWPSFYAPSGEENVATRSDNTFFTRRTEVICGRCQGHLGHVFPDGPAPTGMRYCINSAALEHVAGLEASPEEPPEASDSTF